MLYDIAIVGAGPAGAAAATFLAEAGHRVVLLERETFPRFRIGESLLPLGMKVLAALGLDLADADYALHKAGARIVCESCNDSYTIDFSNTLDPTYDHAYQVQRSQFDAALVARAEQAGAQTHFGVRVKAFTESPEAVHLQLDDGAIQARYLIDATGQSALMAKHHGKRTWVRGLGRLAAFSHYHLSNDAAWQAHFAKGDITVMLLPDHNWAWLIPLPQQHLSLGIVHKDVASAQGLAATTRNLLEDIPLQSPLLRDLLRGAIRTQPVRQVSDFSYYNPTPYSDRCVSVGDACAFLDPVFSSGVSLGLHAAQRLSIAMDPLVTRDAPLELADYSAYMQQGYRVFERVLERFYRPNWAHNTFFAPNKVPRMVTELNTILAGDVWRDDNDWQNQMCGSRRRFLSYEDGANAH